MYGIIALIFIAPYSAWSFDTIEESSEMKNPEANAYVEEISPETKRTFEDPTYKDNKILALTGKENKNTLDDNNERNSIVQGHADMFCKAAGKFERASNWDIAEMDSRSGSEYQSRYVSKKALQPTDYSMAVPSSKGGGLFQGKKEYYLSVETKSPYYYSHNAVIWDCEKVSPAEGYIRHFKNEVELHGYYYPLYFKKVVCAGSP